MAGYSQNQCDLSIVNYCAPRIAYPISSLFILKDLVNMLGPRNTVGGDHNADPPHFENLTNIEVAVATIK